MNQTVGRLASGARKLVAQAITLSLLLATAPAWAQARPSKEHDALQARTRRMDQALAHLAKENAHSSAKPWLSLLVGAAYAGVGVGVAYDRAEEPRSSLFRGVAVTESLVIGGALIGEAAYEFGAGPSLDEDRYARFQRDVRGSQWSQGRLAQYEGELYADARISAIRRRTSGWVNLGVGVAGAGLIALAATSDMRGLARTLVYLEGGVVLPMGVITGIIELESESPNEKEWRKYRLSDNRAPVQRFSMTPILLPNGLGLVAGGKF